MAFMKTLTLKHGGERHQVVVSNGTDIAGMSDGVAVNIDQTNMTKAECLDQLHKIKEHILAGPWPIA